MYIPSIHSPNTFPRPMAPALALLCLILGAIQAEGAPPGVAETVLYSGEIAATNENEEFRALMRATAQNTGWEIEGRECAMVRVMVDERYDQHVFLFQGPIKSDYEFLVGPLSRGSHTIHLEWDRSWTPELREPPNIELLEFRRIDPSEPAREPLLRAPILHIRKDTVGRFSDVPLILYWEIEPRPHGKLLSYTMIFSNEDGGTRAERLMARWGRTADIEWCYAYSLANGVIEETYQARDHKVLPFRGIHALWHPVLYDATENNNFADSLPDPAPVRVRMVPVEAKLVGSSRETVMDRFPWTYAIMAKEMEREGKIEEPADPKTEKLSDQRNYAYLEVCAQQNGTELYFELQLRGQSRWFRSDHGESSSRIERSDCFRSTVELPAHTQAGDLFRLRINCSPALIPDGERPKASPGATLKSVNRLFLLQSDYQPGPNLIEQKINRRLKPGKSLSIEITR